MTWRRSGRYITVTWPVASGRRTCGAWCRGRSEFGFAVDLFEPRTTFEPGKTYRQVWNNVVFTPVFPDAHRSGQWVSRTGDTISVDVPSFGDAAGHPGYSVYHTAHTALSRNGIEVFRSADLNPAQIPPATDGRYRLELFADRGDPFPYTLATQATMAWTFRSKHVDGSTPKVLPLAAIRFAPPVDTTNTAPAGRIYQPTVDVSYDDGRTWRRVNLRSVSGGWVATLTHPKTVGFVSLRAKATDDDGNTVEQTIIHAYAIAPHG